MSEVMMKTSERVKTLSIIDTISELAQNENEASRLTLPSPISNNQNSPRIKSPRKLSTNSSGHVSLGPFLNGTSTPKSPLNVRSLSGHQINDSNSQRTPPLISASSHGSKLSPRTPNFTLYEIDQKQKTSEFMSSTPTSPLLNFSNRSKGIPLSPFSGGARSKLGSLRIIRGSSKEQSISNSNQNESRDVHLRTSDTYKELANNNGQRISHNLSDQKPIQAREKSQSSSVLFGNKLQQPFVTLDSSSGAIETKNGKVQTPDWIREIFQHAKRGNREKLESSLDGLEPTIIRNLTDHFGNNLLHTICVNGHSTILPWLTSRFDSELSGALTDENRKRLTPPTAAVKFGQIECVKWLVKNTCIREKLGRRDGERSLLHAAAKYGKNELVSWLSEEMSSHDQLDVDYLDKAGKSPLHLAARRGNVATVSALLNHGAQIGLKNDMGLKAYDYARLMDKHDCAEFLVLYEASLNMSRDLLEAKCQKDQVQTELNELTVQFKDVMSIAKKLAKEREEMCRELRRLHDSTMELHDNMIMELQVLKEENNSLHRKDSTEADKNHQSSTIDACTSLHEKWQQHHRTWFSSNLAESENKLVLAEENWRRSRLTTNYGNTSVSINGQSLDKSYPQRNLRDLMEELRSSSSQNKNNLISSKSQADYTAADLIVSSESDGNEDEDESPSNNTNNQNKDFSTNNATHQESGGNLSTNHSAVRSQIAQRKKLPTPSPTAQVLGGSPNRHRRDSKSSLDDSVYSSLSNDLYSKINLPVDPQHHQIPDNHHNAPLNETCKNVPFSPILKNTNLQNKTPQLYKKRGQRSDDSYNNKSKRELLKDKMKECSLVSESGTASVIEVIEPTLSEEEDFQNSIREMSWNISVNGSKKENTSSYLSSPKNSITHNSFFGSNEIKTNSPIAIYPSRNDERSSVITITSSNSNTARSSGSSSSSYSVKNVVKFGKGKRRPKSEVGMDGQYNVSNTSFPGQSTYVDNYDDSSSTRYSTYSDVSPTKRLLEMGITTTALNDNNDGADFDEDEEEDRENRFFNNSNDFVKSGATSLKIESSTPNSNNNAAYVIKKKKPHPTSINITGNASANINLNNNNSPVNFTNKMSGGTTHNKTNASITSNLNGSKITFTDLDFLQEHFVDDSFDHGDENQLEQDGDVSKMSSNKKTTFLQKIVSKTKLNNLKKKINTSSKENVETTTYRQNSLNGSPLISQRRAMNSIQAEEDEDDGLEEHILPDSFEDLPGDSNDSADATGTLKKSHELNDEQINEGDKPIFDIINSRTKSLSPSSRKSFLLSTTSTINSSSTATMKSSSGISATSVASTSEDSGIGLMASSSSSALSKSAELKITTNKSNGTTNESSLHNSHDSNMEVFSHPNPTRMKTSIELTLLNGHAHSQNLSKIDEASSVASQSSKSCNSELMHEKSFSNNIDPYTTKEGVKNMNERNFIDTNILSIVKKNSSTKSPIITSNLPVTIASSISISGEQTKLRRNFSNTKAWYDIPSDEDPEAPEADSLASIITHRSHSSEED